jgi:hypothetical protein
VCAAAVAALPLVRASDQVFEVGLRVAIAAVLTLLAALVLARPSLVPAALVLLGGLYGGQLAYDDAALDSAAAAFAAGLLVTAELAYWSVEERERVRAERGDGFLRLAVVALLGVGTLVVAASLLALVDAVRARGLAIDLVGTVAAVAALAAVVVLARRQHP